jgi:hypothetical protein
MHTATRAFAGEITDPSRKGACGYNQLRLLTEMLAEVQGVLTLTP